MRDTDPDMLGRLLGLNRPIVMGILNVTPDSFSDGGQFVDPMRRSSTPGADRGRRRHYRHRRRIHSPYGGAQPIGLEEELRRLTPVLPTVAAARQAGVDRHHEARGRAVGAGRRRRHRQRCLGPAARAGHGARGRRPRRGRWSSCTTATRPIRRSTSSPTSTPSFPIPSISRRGQALRATRSCSIPASASARRRSRACRRSRGSKRSRNSSFRSWSARRANGSSIP
jgi:hypothetical protein